MSGAQGRGDARREMAGAQRPYGPGARRETTRAPWQGTAFLVEACVLLAFVVTAVAVFAALFFGASREAARAERLTQAVAAARNSAERFAAEGTDAAGSREADGLLVRVDVSEDGEVPGLLRAEVVVLDEDGSELYRLKTARAAEGGAS